MKIDGLEILLQEFDIEKIAKLIEDTARWVDPKTFKLLPVWYPEYARGKPYYKGSWDEPQMQLNKRTQTLVQRVESNNRANDALTKALGWSKSKRPNWTCCHLWATDDPTNQSLNVVASDHRYYSCLANMVMLPTPLKGFTDSIPEIKEMMRMCARNLYGWSYSPSGDRYGDWVFELPHGYPKSWPRGTGDGQQPKGIVLLTPEIEDQANRRLEAIFSGIQKRGCYYPVEEVKAALAYWEIDRSPTRDSETPSPADLVGQAA